jgi:hypothetical protein
LLYCLQGDQQEIVLVFQVSHQEREAFNREVDNVIGLIGFAQQRNDLVHDDSNVLAEKRFEDFEEKCEADQRPFCLLWIVGLQQSDESLEKLLEEGVEVLAEVFRKRHGESAEEIFSIKLEFSLILAYSNSGCSDRALALSNLSKSAEITLSLWWSN